MRLNGALYFSLTVVDEASDNDIGRSSRIGLSGAPQFASPTYVNKAMMDANVPSVTFKEEFL